MAKPAKTPQPISLDPQRAKRISRYVLFTVLGGLLTVGSINLYNRYGPAYQTAEAIPYGLEPGTRLRTGERIPSPESIVSPADQPNLVRAEELEQSSHIKEAYEVYSVLVAKYPSLVQANEGAGRTLLLKAEDSTRFAAVENYIHTLEGIKGGKASSQYLKALWLESRGQILESREWFTRASETCPVHAPTREALSRRYLLSGQFSRAIEEARTGISLTHGKNPRLYALLGRSYHDRGDLDSCSNVVEYAATKFPSDPGILLLRGLLAEYRGKFEDAEANYRRILSLGEDTAAREALRTLGEKAPPGSKGGGGSVITPRDRAALAIDILEPLVSQYAENSVVRYALGQAYLKARQFDKARIQFEEVERQDPQFPDIQLRLQEAAANPADNRREQELAETLKRGIDSLRTKQDGRSGTERLGHYLVRWDATPKEFFKTYDLAKFIRTDSLRWRETYNEPPVLYTQTILFDKQGLWGVHVIIHDSSYTGRPGTFFDLFGRLLSINSRISGIGTATGDAECPGSGAFQAVLWETRDNFEMLVQFRDNKSEARLVRLARRKVPSSGRLCDYLPLAKIN